MKCRYLFKPFRLLAIMKSTYGKSLTSEVGGARTGRIVSLYSAPFYTSRHGYKMCLRVYLNGDGTSRETHLPFFLTLMKGEYDALLQWPFSQPVTLMLLDQEIRCIAMNLITSDRNYVHNCDRSVEQEYIYMKNFKRRRGRGGLIS